MVEFSYIFVILKFYVGKLTWPQVKRVARTGICYDFDLGTCVEVTDEPVHDQIIHYRWRVNLQAGSATDVGHVDTFH